MATIVGTPLPTRFIKEIGTRATHRIYWTGECGTRGYHNGETPIGDSPSPRDWDFGAQPEYKDKPLPTKCDHCGTAAPEGASRQVFYRRIYDTPSGEPERGDMYFEDTFHYRDGRCPYWDNCDGKHLIVVTPDGHHWNVDSRARNCTMPEERNHRCWIRTGEPPNVSVGKNGNTCSAGAGSIQTEDWHGFLRGGQLVVN